MKSIIKNILCFELIIEYIIYKIIRKIKNQKESFIFNAPIHGNLGDHAIIYSEKKILKNMNIHCFEVPTFRSKYILKFLCKYTTKEALIFITGGGFVGSDWKEEMNIVNEVLINFNKHSIIFFPQTFYFTKSEDIEKFKTLVLDCKNIYIFTREEKSFLFVKDILKVHNTYIVPDIVLSLKASKFKKNRKCIEKSILFCFRNDKEKKILNQDILKIKEELKLAGYRVQNTDTVITKRVNKFNRKKEINKKLNEFMKNEIIITDRLHWMIFAALTHTPCIVLNNYNYKVSGVYKLIHSYEKIIYINNLNSIKKDINKLNSKNEIEKNYLEEYTTLFEIIRKCYL